MAVRCSDYSDYSNVQVIMLTVYCYPWLCLNRAVVMRFLVLFIEYANCSLK